MLTSVSAEIYVRKTHTHLKWCWPDSSSMAVSVFYQMRNRVGKLHGEYYSKNIAPEPLLMQLSQDQLRQVYPISLRARTLVCGPIYKSPCSSHGCSGVALYLSSPGSCASPLIFLTLCFSISLPFVFFFCRE